MIADENVYTTYQVSPLMKMKRYCNALAFTRAPGVHYGHLEALVSG